MRARISKQGKVMEAARQFNEEVQISTNIQCAVLFNHLVGYFVSWFQVCRSSFASFFFATSSFGLASSGF